MILRSRYRLRRIARLVLVFLFFTQAALAASGCLMPATDMAKAITPSEKSGCGEAGNMNLNLCLAHCTADNQSLDTGELPAFAPPLSVVLVVPQIGYPQRLTFTVVRPQCTSDPPIAIRFCSFQI